jgi:imidazolonepropionase-like amidohydrolase
MGTDAGTPGNHHGLNAHECVLMATRCGLSPAESVRAATINAATLLRREAELGTLEVGKYADVIACANDPWEDLEELTRLVFVMKGGQIERHDQR